MEATGFLKIKFDTNKVSEKFQKRDFVLTTDFDTPYPQHVQFQLSQDKCSQLDTLQVGDMVKVDFNLRGREWNGPQGTKFFNTLDAWRTQLVPGSMRAEPTNQIPQPVNVAPQNVIPPQAAPIATPFDSNDGLPF